jgi:M6 family metalloprotease-like protein
MNGPQRAREETLKGTTLVALAILGCALVAAPCRAQSSVFGETGIAYLWANDPAATTYVVDSRYTMNASPSTVERLAAGHYRVLMDALQATGGNVQVTSYGTAGGFCNIEEWGGGRADVRCFDGRGRAADSRFTIALFRGRPGDDSIAYVWASRPTTPVYVPSFEYTFGSESPRVDRESAGRYTVSLGSIVAGTGANVQVTAYGTDAVHCKAGRWSGGTAHVLCFTATGTPADSRFSLVAIRASDQANDVAYVWADQPSRAEYGPLASYLFNNEEPVRVRRQDAGRYVVGLGNIADQLNGNVQVSAYGDRSGYCAVEGWSAGDVQVGCFDAGGSPVDARFSLLMLGGGRAGAVSVPAPPADLSPFGVDALPIDGAEPVLVILAEFADAPFRAPLGRAFYDDWFFGRGTATDMQSRTVVGYFHENSYGRLVVQRAGLVSVRFPVTRACAFGTSDCPGSTEDGFKYRSRTVQLASEQAGFDFSAFDRNADGRVTPDELAIVAIAASVDSTFGGQRGPKDPNCVPVGSGARAVEVCGGLASFNQNASLMTMIHETSHTWGTKDLYGPGAALNDAMTTMDATEVRTRGVRIVYHLDPWHKMAFGWLQPRFFRTTDPGTCVSMRAAQEAGFEEITSPVVLYDPSRGAREYFILEFRRRAVPGTISSADADMADPDGGLAIWRVQPNARGNIDDDIIITSGADTLRYGRVNYLGAPGLQAGRGRLWRAEDGDILLSWSDGTPVGTTTPVGVTLRVGPLSPTGGGIQVAWFRTAPPRGPFQDPRTEACFRTVEARHAR